jgi:mono/diheme cytochrome c family protein
MKKNEPGMAYDTKKLNKVFAFLSVLALMTVVWVFLDDYIRPWKAVQLEAIQIKKQKLELKLEKAQKGIDQNDLKNLKQDLEEGNKVLSERKREISSIDNEITLVSKEIKEETITNGRLNSKVAATTFNYEHAVAHHLNSEKSLFKKLRDYKKKFATSKDRMKSLGGKKKKLIKSKLVISSVVDETQKKLAALTSKSELLELALSKTTTGPIFALRNAPMIDYLDPTLKIQQIVLENITDDRYFQHVPKVDRCITCHTFINQTGFEDQPNPHKTHPNLDLMVGKDSPHPMKQTGCTSCHGGEGHRVNDFSAPVHVPENAKQAAVWKKKYNWSMPHKTPSPMFKLSQTEAGCVKCHNEVEFIPGATVLNEGRRNMEKFGCYACHKIEGWEHKRTPGPSLKKIASKVDKEFFKNWVWDPKSFNKHANMPRFFGQSNNSKPEFMKKNIAEVNAMAEFIWDKSKPYKPFMKFVKGDAKRGKELTAQVGCMGCHGVEDYADESKKINAYAGPYLTGTGSKVDPDWLVSWLKKPSHYQEDTIMPSFRLSDKEANDIATYLLSLRNKKFDQLRFSSLDKAARDEILVTYFSAFDTQEVAQAKLAKMSDRERTLELGHRSIGKYGCYSCHSIEGFAGRAPIGPELTKEGSKPLTQFGYGIQHDIEHSRDGWIKAHLINPRRWDIGIDKPFSDLTRMPNFNMTERQAETMTVAIIGQVADRVPLAGIHRLDANERIVAEGMKVVNKFNCVGCHKIDGERGDILAKYDDDINEGPPRLNGQGHRVQADWFHYFLDNVYPIRPWLQIRMPSYELSNDERNAIVTMFQHKAKQPTFADVPKSIDWNPGEKAAAKELFSELACASCHTSGFNKDEALAPNLYFVKRKLRPSWVKKWLLNPQAILPGTSMPSFWEDGESQAPDILGGDVDKQIDALTKYMYEIGTDKLPTKSTNYWSKQ